jgi:5-methylcytosine-specific restriction endonuclease McrA
MTYDEYLRSLDWETLRHQALERDSFRCRLCDSRDDLDVHHRKYPPRGRWHFDCLDHLTTLCRQCHGAVTSELRARLYSTQTSPLLSDVVRRTPKVL